MAIKATHSQEGVVWVGPVDIMEILDLGLHSHIKEYQACMANIPNTADTHISLKGILTMSL